MYNSSFTLVGGSDNYTVNSWAPKFDARDEAGGMTILLQNSVPEQMAKGTYWLQSPDPDSPDGGGFYMILRVYVPAPRVATTQTWLPPSVVRSQADES